ncbi:MAG: hypothetical protein M1825_003078 [Sarcosagium campestre]|nr:MAG: hypothetical protein M1825_003078 [Sarcosagium campestre]
MAASTTRSYQSRHQQSRSSSSPLLRWLSEKRYQYEVTFSLYMLTPTEKFIFNSFLFLVLSMIVIAASLYLPQHVREIGNRAWWYYSGGEEVGGAAGGKIEL